MTGPQKPVQQSLSRTARAMLRDFRVLLKESWLSLSVFALTLAGGALLFHLFYVYPDTGQHPALNQALHATFALIFFETLLPYPQHGWLQLLFFLVPVLGLTSAASGVVRFMEALLSKRSRGQKWQVAMASTYRNHVIVCGVGRVGYRVILELQKLGREVVAVEPDADARFLQKVRDMGVPVITADARRTETIISAGVKAADVIIPCTDNELTNLDIALDAREINPGIKVVMRMLDQDLGRRIEKGFGIHTADSTSALAAPIFAAAAMRVNIRHSFYVDDNLLNLSELTVNHGARFSGWTVEQLEQELDLSVVYHRGSAGSDFHPAPALSISPGDFLLVLASLPALRRLAALNPADGDLADHT